MPENSSKELWLLKIWKHWNWMKIRIIKRVQQQLVVVNPHLWGLLLSNQKWKQVPASTTSQLSHSRIRLWKMLKRRDRSLSMKRRVRLKILSMSIRLTPLTGKMPKTMLMRNLRGTQAEISPRVGLNGHVYQVWITLFCSWIGMLLSFKMRSAWVAKL